MSTLTGSSGVLYYSPCVYSCIRLLPDIRSGSAGAFTQCSAFSFGCWCQYSLAAELVNRFSDCFTYSCISAAQSQFVTEVSRTCQAWNTDIATVFNPSNPLRSFLPSPTSTIVIPSSTISTLQSTSLFVSTTMFTSPPTSVSSTDTTEHTGNNGHLTSKDKGAIAGGVVGGFLGLATLTALFFWWRRKRHSTTSAAELTDGAAGPELENTQYLPPQEIFSPPKEQRTLELMSSGLYELPNSDSMPAPVVVPEPMVIERQDLPPITADTRPRSSLAHAETADDVGELERLKAEEERIRERRSILLERMGRQSNDLRES